MTTNTMLALVQSKTPWPATVQLHFYK